MTDARFREVYADAELRDFVHDMARRLSRTREDAEDAESEAWLAIAQAPDGVSMQSLTDAVVTTVASSVWQTHGKPSRAARKWISVLRQVEWNGAKMDGRAM